VKNAINGIKVKDLTGKEAALSGMTPGMTAGY